MANIAISELNTTATSLNDEDLILVSKTEDNGGSYTSAKMKGSVLKSGVSNCQFSEDKIENALSSYNVVNYDILNYTIENKLNEVSEKQNEQLTQLNQLITKIGNKVFKDEISTGDTYTLSLIKDGEYGSTADPTGGGTYKKGTRVTIIAATPSSGYTFSGWYQDSVLITTNLAYSWEVTGDVILKAKYGISTMTPSIVSDFVYITLSNKTSERAFFTVTMLWCLVTLD